MVPQPRYVINGNGRNCRSGRKCKGARVMGQQKEENTPSGIRRHMIIENYPTNVNRNTNVG